MVNLGYIWEFDAPEIGGNFSFKVESISESVQVPAGTFYDCIKIKLIVTNMSGDTTQFNHYYYAEDVGEVLNICWSEWSGDMQLELTEYNVQLQIYEKNSPGIPIHFRLQQNYPNPFNPSTTISYELPKSSFVNMSIYNVAGQLVEKLVNDNKSPGYYSVEWNVENFSSGIYLYRIDAGEFSSVKKCLVVK